MVRISNEMMEPSSAGITASAALTREGLASAIAGLFTSLSFGNPDTGRKGLKPFRTD